MKFWLFHAIWLGATSSSDPVTKTNHHALDKETRFHSFSLSGSIR